MPSILFYTAEPTDTDDVGLLSGRGWRRRDDNNINMIADADDMSIPLSQSHVTQEIQLHRWGQGTFYSLFTSVLICLFTREKMLAALSVSIWFFFSKLELTFKWNSYLNASHFD